MRSNAVLIGLVEAKRDTVIQVHANFGGHLPLETVDARLADGLAGLAPEAVEVEPKNESQNDFHHS